MRRHADEAAYAAGWQTVIDLGKDWQDEAMRRARAYVASRRLEGSEALPVIWSFLSGLYDVKEAQAAQEAEAKDACDKHTPWAE